MKMNVGEKQFFAVELDSMRDPDVTHISTRARRPDGLHHRLLSSDALQHRVDANTFCHFLDAFNAFVAALGDDVSRTKLAGERLSRWATRRDRPSAVLPYWCISRRDVRPRVG